MVESEECIIIVFVKIAEIGDVLNPVFRGV